MSAPLPNPTCSLPINYLAWGVAGSLMAHLILAALLLASRPQLEAPPAGVSIMVDWLQETPSSRSLEPAAEQVRRQIVSPPQNQADAAVRPPNPFLSDKDSSADREQIKRGDGMDAGIPGKPQAAQGKAEPKAASPDKAAPGQVMKTKSPPPSGENLESEVQLKLDDRVVAQKFGVDARPDIEQRLRAAVSGESAAGGPVLDFKAYQPFSRASGSGARFLGAPGSSDYLPNLPDGDITLLNTKANVFAVFVRRVATQVFAQMRSAGWEFLRAQDIRSMSRETTVLAVLSPQGQLLTVSVDSPSASEKFDQVLIQAVKQGARDPNPPAAAVKEDGNIHFIFKARSWVQFTGNPRTGAPMERRWLMLATGLE